ncbi:MAG: ferritin family protein [Planctomycetes bacterium]|jgi:rubrerythrin|nr:ferritin family protein [Planctomycetota bacterium]
MDTQFNVFEILQIAEKVESKAAKFYLHAAEQFADAERRNVCRSLAGWRTEHRDTWRCIRRRYTERTGEFGTFDPSNYVLSNPQVMAGLAGPGTDLYGPRRIARYETKEQIVQDAIRRSQGIIIFYHGLKEFTRGPDARMMIDNAISEEDRHIHLLTHALEPVPSTADDFDDPASVAMSDPDRGLGHASHLMQN